MKEAAPAGGLSCYDEPRSPLFPIGGMAGQRVWISFRPVLK